MVEIEDVHDLAKHIADLIGIYLSGPELGDHPDDCPCRMCFVLNMEDRIREAVENEEYLKTR